MPVILSVLTDKITNFIQNNSKNQDSSFIFAFFYTFATNYIMRSTKQIISLFFVALLMSFYASTSFFSHSHEFTWGAVTHSHIHTNSHHDTQSGGHTDRCIILIAQISHFEYIDFSCYSIPSPSQLPLHKNKLIETTHWVASIYFQNLSLRAPPIV